MSDQKPLTETVSHFELITEVISVTGQRVRLDGAIFIGPTCPLCDRRLIDENGDVRASIATVDGRIQMTHRDGRCPR